MTTTAGDSTMAHMRNAARRAQTVLLDQTSFNVDTERFRRFRKQLQRGVLRDAGLERLMAVKAPWDKTGPKR